MNSCIYNGVVTHQRFKPIKHALKYKTFSLLIDLDELELLSKKISIFSLNKFNVFSFYKKAPLLLSQNITEETLGGYLNKSKLSNYFIEYHIIPMVAAIWSMPFEKAKDMPLKLFLNFFINHGLFKLKTDLNGTLLLIVVEPM